MMVGLLTISIHTNTVLSYSQTQSMQVYSRTKALNRCLQVSFNKLLSDCPKACPLLLEIDIETL